MFTLKYFFFTMKVFILPYIIQSLEEMPPIPENGIVQSEAVIRHTFNNLFHSLKLRKLKDHQKFKDYSIVHKYFMSLALQDYDNLNQIARIVRVNNKVTNKTTDFMEIINNFDTMQQNTDRTTKEFAEDDERVISYITYFLTVLKKLKVANSVDKANLNVNINILKYLNGKQLNTSRNVYSKSDDNNTLSENEFWIPSGRRIFKGQRSKIKHFPFMASIQIFNNFHCAGSIIKSDLIITASSCLQLAWNNRLFRENPAFLSVRIGSSFYNVGGEVIPIQEIYFHPEYNPKNLRNNLSLLRLARHLNFRRKSRKIKKIDFDRQPSSLPVTTSGITILGWGAKEHSPVIGNPWKNVLSFFVLDIYPLEECQDVYSREYVSKKNFCAGFFTRGGGACNRDVGGPGISDGKLIGVISFGSPVCGTPDAPTVFTKLGYYTDWIEEIMEMDVPVSKKRTTAKPMFDPFTAPPSFTSSKPTTFKIAPINGEKMTPIPITLIDSQLRIFDENLFQDFLTTMFHGNRASEHQDYLKHNRENKELNAAKTKKEKYEKITTNLKPETTFSVEQSHTEIIDVSLEQSDLSKDTAVTLMNEENQPVPQDFDKEIENLIDNVNLEKIVKEEVMVTPMAAKDVNEDIDIKTSESDNSNKKNELTLLYLSDDDKKGKAKLIAVDDTNDEINEGLSIPIDKFDDLTRAKEKDANVLSESELYGLLDEFLGQ